MNKKVVGVSAAVAGFAAASALALTGSTGPSAQLGSSLVPIAVGAPAPSANVTRPGSITIWAQPGPPIPPLPLLYGAIVHLKSGACNQLVSVTARDVQAGGKGVVFVRDAPTSGATDYTAASWLTVFPQGDSFPMGAIDVGFWWKHDFAGAGSYTLTFASTDCVTGAAADQSGIVVPSYKSNAATVKLKITA